MVVKAGVRVDGGWFRKSMEGSTITGCDKITRIWTLYVESFVGSSADDGAIKTRGTMRVNEGEGFARIVRHTGCNIPAAVVSLFLLVQLLGD